MDQLFTRIDRQVAQYAQTNFSPSGIVAVARSGEHLHTATWGPDGYTLDTPFRIASCTKSFTGLALLILRRQGKLSLDDPLEQHIPEFTLDSRVSGDWPLVRLSHLIAMSSGLGTDNPWGDRQESISRDELIEMVSSGVRLLFAPGTDFEYSNLGYALLGEVITRVAGVDYRDFIHEQILTPLGLENTRFVTSDDAVQGWHRQPMLPGQDSGWSAQEPSGPGAFSSIGGLFSTARDLTRWAQLYLRHDVPAGVQFTAGDLMEAQQSLRFIENLTLPAPLRQAASSGYGFGLFIEDAGGLGRLISHAGGYPGFTAYMYWHADSGFSVVASSNGTRSNAPRLAREVMFEILADQRAAKTKVRPWAETVDGMELVRQLVADVAGGVLSDAQVLERYADRFAENVDMDFPLSRRLEFLRLGMRGIGEVDADQRPASKPTHLQPSHAKWQIPAQYGYLEVTIELEPLAPYRLQTFSVAAVNGHTRAPLFL